MPFLEHVDPLITNWIIVPLLIFVARIIDVSIGTIRIIFVSRGKRFLAPVLGFFEVIIWLLAIGQIMQNLHNFASYIAYGLGFAMGNYVGIILEERLAMGRVMLRIATKRDGASLIQAFKEMGLGVTSIGGNGVAGPVHIIFSIMERADLKRVLPAINRHNPDAFWTVEDVRTSEGGVFPRRTPIRMRRRKGK